MTGSRALRIRALVVLFLVVLGATWAFVLSRPEVLIVERVVFEGNREARVPALRHLADVRNGSRLWSVDPSAVSARVMRHPWVERVTTTRSFDGTVRIVVDEREPVALLSWGGRMLYVDDGGWPFLESDGHRLDLPILLGVGPKVEARDPGIPPLVVRDALWLLDRLDAERLLPKESVSDVTFEWHRGFTVRTTAVSSDRLPSEILFGFDGYARQVRRFAKLVEQGLDWTTGVHVDLAPASVAVIRPLAQPGATGDGGSSPNERRARPE